MATLYVLEQGALVTKIDERLVVRKDRKVLRDLPAHQVERIVLFGNAHLSTPATHFVLRQGIEVVYLSQRGVYYGRLQPEVTQDGSLRHVQHQRASDSRFCLELARSIVQGKIANLEALCARQRRQGQWLREALERLGNAQQRLPRAHDLDALRGYEGSAAVAYYRAFGEMLRRDWGFGGRRHRPPPDPINALLSLGYTLLYQAMQGMIGIVGLDPYQGFFHQMKPGHAALASDLIEEWRPIIVDSLVLQIVNRGELQPADFRSVRDQARLTREGLARFLEHYDARLAERVEHPRLGKKLSYRQSLEEQVRHLGRVLLGEEPTYQPFRTR